MPSAGLIQPSREEIEKWLRDALNHLYDVGYLENHPLGEVLLRPEEMSGKRGADLRKVLIAAIQARKPARGAPPQSPDVRGYQILELHILAGLNPAEASRKLNISRSLFFLEKARILKIIFDDLWSQRLQQAAGQVGAQPAGSAEAEHLLQGAVFEPVEIRSLLDSLRPLIMPLAQVYRARVEIQSEVEAAIPRGDRVLLRQVCLSLVSELLQKAAGGELTIAAFDQGGAFGVHFEARPAAEAQPDLRPEERRGLGPETVYAVLERMNGRLTIEQGAGGAAQADLSWLHPHQARQLLLVDDHPDLVSLVTRYLDGSGWEILWASSAENARRILAAARPALILLDVILPHEDGWEFLIALKADPLTRLIPVVVCSAIHEPDLVRSLGAQGYLPKPFSAAQLVQALAQYGP